MTAPATFTRKAHEYDEAARASREHPETVEWVNALPEADGERMIRIVESREAVLLDDVDRGSDVFLSHASADNDVATRLYQALEARGVSVWVDLAGMQFGFSVAASLGELSPNAGWVLSSSHRPS